MGQSQISPIDYAEPIDIKLKQITTHLEKRKCIINIFANKTNKNYALGHVKIVEIVDVSDKHSTIIINLRVLFLNNLPVIVTYKNTNYYIALIESSYFTLMKKTIIDQPALF